MADLSLKEQLANLDNEFITFINNYSIISKKAKANPQDLNTEKVFIAEEAKLNIFYQKFYILQSELQTNIKTISTNTQQLNHEIKKFEAMNVALNSKADSITGTKTASHEMLKNFTELYRIALAKNFYLLLGIGIISKVMWQLKNKK